MAKRLFVFFDTLFDVTAALILLPQFMYFSFATSRSWVWDYYKDTRLESLPAYVCLFMLLFASFTFIRLAVTYNKPLRQRFLQQENVNSLIAKLLFLADQTEFWIKAGIIAIIYILLPFKWTLAPLAYVTHATTEKDKILWLSAFFAVLFVSAVLAHLSAYKRWGIIKDDKAYTRKRHAAEAVSACMVYVGGAFAFLTGLPVISPILSVVYKEIKVWHIIGILVLLSIPFVFGLVRAVLKRKTFLKRLKALCEEKGYKVSQIRLPYLSLFLYSGGESFTLTVGEKVYSCKLIPGRKRNVPIVFSADGRLAFIHAVKMRGAVIHQRVKIYNFGFESENPKILIVNPVPKQVFIECADKHIEIDNGSVVGDYKFFAATGFLHAAELNVLDK